MNSVLKKGDFVTDLSDYQFSELIKIASFKNCAMDVYYKNTIQYDGENLVPCDCRGEGSELKFDSFRRYAINTFGLFSVRFIEFTTITHFILVKSINNIECLVINGTHERSPYQSKKFYRRKCKSSEFTTKDNLINRLRCYVMEEINEVSEQDFNTVLNEMIKKLENEKH